MQLLNYSVRCHGYHRDAGYLRGRLYRHLGLLVHRRLAFETLSQALEHCTIVIRSVATILDELQLMSLQQDSPWIF